MIPKIQPGETCSQYWTRLTPDERSVAQTLQKMAQHVTMTSWLLARGCKPVYQPPHPSRYTSKLTMANFVGRKVVRREAASV